MMKRKGTGMGESDLREFGFSSVICFLMTVLFLVLYSGHPETPESPDEAIQQLRAAGMRYYLTFINAALITASATVTFEGLFRYCRENSPRLSSIGRTATTVYCAINLFAYCSQLALPTLLKSAERTREDNRLMVSRFMHGYEGSMVGRINALAYAVLGIPSITYGIPLLKMGRFGKISGSTLILSAIADVIGFIGSATGNEKAGLGLIIGAVFFLLSLITITPVFFDEQQSVFKIIRDPDTCGTI